MKSSKIKSIAVKNRIATASAQLTRHIRYLDKKVKSDERKFSTFRFLCDIGFYSVRFNEKSGLYEWRVV